jgi:hydroxymethylglutaryl-CoA lyase
MAGRSVEIVEVSPRDGLQNENTLVSTQDKVTLVNRALAAGVRRMEVTSFVNPKRVPQMADAEAVMAALTRPEGVGFIGLALNEKGFERAVAAGCNEVNFVVVASETFNQRNQGVSIADTLAMWTRIAAAARSSGVSTSITIGASFGCPFEGEVPAGKVLELAERVLRENPNELAFADTIGCGVPSQVTELLHGARKLSGGVKLRCHFHNTRGTGIANVAAAVEAGVDALDASIGGIGGCPFAPAATGNVATEDVVYMLDRMEVSTGLDLAALIETAQWLEGVLDKPVASALRRAGGFPPAPMAAE